MHCFKSERGWLPAAVLAKLAEQHEHFLVQLLPERFVCWLFLAQEIEGADRERSHLCALDHGVACRARRPVAYALLRVIGGGKAFGNEGRGGIPEDAGLRAAEVADRALHVSGDRLGQSHEESSQYSVVSLADLCDREIE